jgi:hypothetical protein
MRFCKIDIDPKKKWVARLRATNPVDGSRDAPTPQSDAQLLAGARKSAPNGGK